MPTRAAPVTPVAQARTLVLQHVIPGDILKALHWDQAARRLLLFVTPTVVPVKSDSVPKK